jgi:hypothetical protein
MTGRRDAISISISAGLGGAFGLVLWRSAWSFWNLSRWDQFDEGIAILVVALGVVKFIEPISRGLKKTFKAEPHCDPLIKKRSIQIVTFLILVGTSLAHGLLHKLVQNNPSGIAGIVLAGLLIPGGITYCWLWGAGRTPPRAKRFGLLGGIILCTGMLWAFYVLMGGRLPIGGGLVRVPVADAETAILFLSIPWAIIGFAGGLAVDKGWGKRPSRAILLSIVSPLLLLDLYFVLTHEVGIIQAMDDWLKTIGWGIGIMLHPDADIMLTINRPAAPATQTIPDTN